MNALLIVIAKCAKRAVAAEADALVAIQPFDKLTAPSSVERLDCFVARCAGSSQ